MTKVSDSRKAKLERRIRRALVKNTYMTQSDIVAATGIAQPEVSLILRSLVERKEAMISHQISDNSRKPTNVYTPTSQYLTKLEYHRDYQSERTAQQQVQAPQGRPFAITMHEPTRKPWYKRAVSWLTGDSDLRTGA